MVVDAELGMPLDLSVWDCLWEEGADDSGTSGLFNSNRKEIDVGFGIGIV